MSRSLTRKGPVHWPAANLVAFGLGLILAGCADDSAPAGDATSAGAVLVAAAQGDVSSVGSPLGGSPYGSYLAGLFAGSQRDLSVAADFMLESLAYDPDNAQLLNRAFMLVAGDGRHAKAVELARQLIAVNPDHGLATLVVAVDAVVRGAPEEANILLSGLPAKGLSTITVPLVGAWLHVADGDVAGALRTIEPLKEKAGFNVFHGLHAAMMNDVAGRWTRRARATRKSCASPQGRPCA